MPNNFEVRNLTEGLNDLAVSLESIDMEKVKRDTLKKSADAMAEMVRLAVVAEPNINTPASLNSPYESGPGYSMSRRNAWQVKEMGDQYIVTPHPKVEQRAVVLNYGVSGRITPDDSDYLWFEINGVPHSVPSVEGPEYTGYWQAAMRRFQSSDKMKRIAEAELRQEALGEL